MPTATTKLLTFDEAYEIAADQGFEGTIFHSEQDAGVGRVDHVRMVLDDGSIWQVEVSEANGCEGFSEWSKDSDRFYRECIDARKVARKTRRHKTAKA